MISFLCLAINFAAAANPISEPTFPISTDREGVDFLARIHRMSPDIFNKRTHFDRHALELLKEQRRIDRWVKSVPGYGSLMALRPSPLSFDLDIDASLEFPVNTFDENSLNYWKTQLRQSASELEVALNSEQDPTRAFNRALESVLSKSADLDSLSVSDKWKVAGLLELKILYSMFQHEDTSQLKLIHKLIDTVNEGTLDIFIEQEYVHRGLSGIHFEKSFSMDAARRLMAIFNRALYEHSRQIPSAFKGQIRIEEVPPELGIFRGFFGQDCATSESFAYVNSPLEHTFFIYSDDGKPLAYAAGTQIFFNGKRAFYLHTINGPDITPIQVDQVFRAFYQLRAKLNSDAIVFPIPDRVSQNMNYALIKSIYLKNIGDGKPGAITYRDSPVRGELNQTTHAPYDREDKNTLGIAYSPETSTSEPRVLVNTRPRHLSQMVSNPTVTNIDRTMLALGLARSERHYLVSEVLRTSKLDRGELDQLSKVLSYGENVTVDKILEALSISPNDRARKQQLSSYAKDYFPSARFSCPAILK